MECSNCHGENPESARFCQHCGMPLQIACSNCGTSLRSTARFCYNCGTPVAANSGAPVARAPDVASAPSAVDDRLQQYIPRELLGKLEAARRDRSTAGERRIVTVLFCDVKGSTSMAEMLDPEEWAEIMNGMFKYLIEPVYKYEGTLARLMGDAILAFFGAPITHEDDPQRAVLAGLEIVESIKPYREQIRRRYDLDLNVRVGINTGLVVVGEVGSDLRVEYTAMGDAVNVASRMEQTADPGTVLISGNTYKPISSLFEFEPLGDIEVRGKAEPIPAYRVIKARHGAVPTRGIEGLQSPLVGRDAELRTLQDKVDVLRMGRGGIAAITGEAGLGKSRLLAELRKSVLAASEVSPARNTQHPKPGIAWHEGRSLSYETNTPFAPFVDLFWSVFGLQEGDTGPAAMDKIRALIDEVMGGQGDAFAPFFGTVLGLAMSPQDEQRVRYLEPPALRGSIFQIVPSFFGALAARGPVVLVFEDLHWVDPTSLELLTTLLPLTENAPILILALFRPNRQDPSWALHELASREYDHLYTHVGLQPLDETRSRQLVANLLEIEDLPEKVRALILRKAEGNPFFVEEVIRSLLDAGLVIRENDHWRATREIENIAVPDTLAGVITARLDRLDDEAKHTAQTAAVVGREFRYDVLEDVYDVPASLSAAITTLQRRELVRERERNITVAPTRIYLFKHVLTQETAYSSMLMSRRRAIHLKVAECLERNEQEPAAEIARHFVEARQEDRALPYLLEAAGAAARAGAREEAVSFYRKALDIALAAEDLPMARRSFEGLGKALEFGMDIPGAVETYHHMLHYAEDRNDIPMKVSALNKMSFLRAFMMGEFGEAESHLVDAEQLARDYDDFDGLFELYTVKCGMCTVVSDFSNADKYLTEAVRLGRKTQQKDRIAYGMAHHSQTLAFMARFEESYQVAQEGLQVAAEAGNLEHRAAILSFPVPMYHLQQGNLQTAYEAAVESYGTASRIGALVPTVISSYMLGLITQMRGEYEASIDWFTNSVTAARPMLGFLPFLAAMPLGALGMSCQELSDKLNDRVLEYHAETLNILKTPMGAPGGGSGWADLGFCALALGFPEEAEQHFQRGLTQPSNNMYTMRPRLLAGAALAALALGKIEDARRYALEARTYTEEHSMKAFYPLVYLVDGHVKETLGDSDAALASYERTEQLALEMGMRPALWQARAAAARTLDGLGRHKEASDKLNEARAVIDDIAANFKDEDYRQMFLDSATNRLVMSKA